MAAAKNIESTQSQMYDLFAPAVYGKILNIVHKGPIAEKILEKIFVEAFSNKDTFSNTFRPPLTILLNASRDKSYKSIKALNILRDCCEASGVATVIPPKSTEI